MGLVHADIELINSRPATRPPLAVNALVGTGAVTLCLPEDVADALGWEELERREATFAHGEKKRVPHVGPVQVRFAGRSCFTGALVLGRKVLLGAVPLEDMDLVISPLTRRLTVDPESPDIPSALVMDVRHR